MKASMPLACRRASANYFNLAEKHSMNVKQTTILKAAALSLSALAGFGVGVIPSTALAAEPANLRPFKVPDWPAPIRLRLDKGNLLYAAWAAYNAGGTDVISEFQIELWLDGGRVGRWMRSRLRANRYTQELDFLIPITLAPGRHTIELRLDSGNRIRESNERDNSFVGNFTVSAPKVEKFPVTSITSKSSTSPYAMPTLNPFARDGFAGQCTWFAYARVQELVGASYLPNRAGEKLRTVMDKGPGRNAAQWPGRLGGSWTSTSQTKPLPSELRKPGMLVVYPGPGAEGHIGFLEEVSKDGAQFRMSEFNRRGTEQFTDSWYYFDANKGSPNSSLGSSGSDARYWPIFLDVTTLR